MAFAKQTIVQRIALDGGKEIRAELATLGSAGEKAFKQLRDAVNTSNSPLATVSQSIATFRQEFGSSVGAFGAFSGALGHVALRVLEMKAALDLAIIGFTELGLRAIEAVRDSNVAAQAAGLTVDRFNSISEAGRLVGLEAGQLGRAIGKINLGMVEFQKGQIDLTRFSQAVAENWAGLESAVDRSRIAVGNFFRVPGVSDGRFILITEKNKQDVLDLAQKFGVLGAAVGGPIGALQELGIQIEKVIDKSNTSGGQFKGLSTQLKPVDQILLELADAFKKMEDGSRKSALAIELFGERIGLHVLPLLNLGRKGLEDYFNQLKKLGIGTEEDKALAHKAEEIDKQTGLIAAGVERLKQIFFVELGHHLEQPLKDFIQFLGDNRKQIVSNLKATAHEIAQFITDVVTVFNAVRGQNGQLQFIDGRSVSEQNKFLISIRETAEAVGKAIKFVAMDVLLPAFRTVTAALDVLAKQLNAVFGTEFTGTGLLVTGILLRWLGVFTLIGAAITLVRTALFTLIPAAIGVGTALTAVFATSAGAAFLAMLTRIRAAMVAIGAALGFGALGATFGTLITRAGAFLLLLLRILSWPALLITGLALLIANFEQLKKIATDTWDKIREGVSTIWSGFLTAARDAWLGVIRIAADALEAVGEIIRGVWGFVNQIILDMWSGFKTVAADAWSFVSRVASDTWAGISRIMTDSWAAVTKVSTDMWSGVTRVATDTWNGIARIAADSFSGVTTVIQGVWDGFKAVASSAFSGIGQIASDAFNGIATAAQAVASRITLIFSGISDFIGNLLGSIVSAVTGGLVGGVQKVIDAAAAIQKAVAQAASAVATTNDQVRVVDALVAPFEAAVVRIKELLGPEIRSAVDAAKVSIVSSWQSLAFEIRQALATDLVSAVDQAMQSITNSVQNMIENLINQLDRLIARINAARNAGSSGGSGSFAGGDSGEGFARGGFVSGPGSSTSDSIPAWLSSGEFVLRAEAVRKYGLAFLERLNGMRAPASFSMGRLGFAGGGLVPQLRMPGLSSAAGGSPLTLVIGGQQFGGMTVSDNTAQQLSHFASQAAARNLGRRPSWYGG
jgi:phage-related protein